MKTSCAIIAGASQGIGAEIARLFSKNGYSLILLSRNLNKLNQIAQSLSTPVECISVDFTQSESIAKACNKIYESPLKNHIDTLIYNAGVFERMPFLKTPLGEWDRQYQTSLRGPAELLKSMHPLLQQNSPAQVTFISSTASLKAVANTAAYSSLKAAMNVFAKDLALEWASDKIRVNTICPGIVNTPIHDFYMEDKPTEEKSTNKEKQAQRDELNALHPLGRIGQPKDVAELCLFLSSQKSEWNTGTLHVVDGGLSLL